MASNESDAAQVYLLGKTYLSNNQAQFLIRDDPIVQMAAGDLHTIIVTERGRAFAFGENNSGQLGLGHKNNVDKVSCIKTLKFGDTGERVTLVACGRDASIIATNRGTLFGFGSNERSQLGIESSEIIHSQPVKIDYFKGRYNWKQLAMGAEHTCALTEEGDLYIWGVNEDGQCAQAEKITVVKTPKTFRVPEDQVISVSCGYYHTAVVTTGGRLYACGNNDDNQLGYNSPDKFAGPIHVPIPGKVKAVACGNQHTIVLTDVGEVYACGRGDRGQLGLTHKIMEAKTFQLIRGLPKEPVAIAAGEGHSVVLGARGDIVVFGDGKHGKLGSSTHSNEFQPCSVEKFKGYKISKVVCGGCQTILLAQKKSGESKRTSGSEEDIGNQTLSVTQRPKSRARNARLQTSSGRPFDAGDSIDTTMEQAKPLRSSGHLRVEADDDDDKSDKELSASMKSATFNQTHTISNGKFLPTQSPLLNRTAVRSNDEDNKLLKTGALDRTVRLNKDADELTKTTSRFPTLDRSPVPNARAEHTNSPRRKKADSDSDKSSAEEQPRSFAKKPEEQPKPFAKKAEEQPSSFGKKPDESLPPLRNNRKNSPPTRRKVSSASDDDDNKNRFNRSPPTKAPITEKPRGRDDSDDDDTNRFNRSPPTKAPINEKPNGKPRGRDDSDDDDKSRFNRSSPTKAPISEKPTGKPRGRDDSDDDDKSRFNRSPPTKAPASERPTRKSHRQDDSDDDDSDDDDDDPRSTNRSAKQPPPPVARRSSLPPEKRPGGTSSTPRDGNQTIGSRPADGVRGSFRSGATKTLHKPNAPSPNEDAAKKETPAAQPGFFSRLFGGKSTPPPPPPPPAATTTSPAGNTTSKTCSIM